MGFNDLVEFFKYLSDHLGIAYAIALLIIGGGLYYIHNEKEKHIASKDKEIDRLTKEKDRLQEFVFSELTKLKRKK